MNYYENIKKIAHYKIDLMKSFKSTVDYPSPSFLPFGRDEDEIAAVLSGSKPSAIVQNNKKNDILVELLKIAKEENYFVLEIEDYIYVSKDESIIKKLVTTTLISANNINEIIDRNISVGRLLGYCEEAIYDFIEYGIKKNMSYVERANRRKLIST